MQALFGDLDLPTLLALFAVASGAVWFAGSRLAVYVDAITERTGLGQAFIGMLLLGGITSLPEVAAVTTSAAAGNAPLAVNNLLGTASINILLLALADVVFGKEALTAIAARPVTLLQGVVSMLLATAVAMIATVGDVDLFGVGAGAFALAATAVIGLWLTADFRHRHVWEVVGLPDKGAEAPHDERSTKRLSLYIGLCALLILAAGFVLSTTADRIASETGLQAGLVGFILVGFATSLPEVSSITAAVRMRRYQLAIGDVFGTNIFNIMLIFLADLVYRQGPVLAEAGRFEVIGAILAVFMTGIFIVGLLERRDRTVFRMGYDSLAAVIVFAGGMALLSVATG